MRIRSIKPAFWSDKRVAALPVSAQLTFIGLWQLADDGGWICWDLEQACAEMRPYWGVKAREKAVAADVAALVSSGMVARHEPCGCLQVVNLEAHQRVVGTKTYRARDAHRKHLLLTTKQDPLSRSPVLGREGGVGKGSAGPSGADGNDGEPDGLVSKLGTFDQVMGRPS